MAQEASKRVRARALRALVARAAALPARPGRHTLAELMRQAAARRLERRLGAGVLVVADVREEQDLLSRLVAVTERGCPLPAEAFDTIQRLVSEKAPPSLPASLAQLRRLPQLRLPAHGDG